MSTDRLPDITMLWCPRCKDRKPPFCALFYGIYVNPATRQAEHVSLNKLPNRVSDRQATLNTAAVRAFRAHFQSAHKVDLALFMLGDQGSSPDPCAQRGAPQGDGETVNSQLQTPPQQQDVRARPSPAAISQTPRPPQTQPSQSPSTPTKTRGGQGASHVAGPPPPPPHAPASGKEASAPHPPTPPSPPRKSACSRADGGAAAQPRTGLRAPHPPHPPPAPAPPPRRSGIPRGYASAPSPPPTQHHRASHAGYPPQAPPPQPSHPAYPTWPHTDFTTPPPYAHPPPPYHTMPTWEAHYSCPDGAMPQWPPQAHLQHHPTTPAWDPCAGPCGWQGMYMQPMYTHMDGPTGPMQPATMCAPQYGPAVGHAPQYPGVHDAVGALGQPMPAMCIMPMYMVPTRQDMGGSDMQQVDSQQPAPSSQRSHGRPQPQPQPQQRPQTHVHKANAPHAKAAGGMPDGHPHANPGGASQLGAQANTCPPFHSHPHTFSGRSVGAGHSGQVGRRQPQPDSQRCHGRPQSQPQPHSRFQQQPQPQPQPQAPSQPQPQLQPQHQPRPQPQPQYHAHLQSQPRFQPQPQQRQQTQPHSQPRSHPHQHQHQAAPLAPQPRPGPQPQHHPASRPHQHQPQPPAPPPQPRTRPAVCPTTPNPAHPMQPPTRTLQSAAHNSTHPHTANGSAPLVRPRGTPAGPRPVGPARHPIHKPVAYPAAGQHTLSPAPYHTPSERTAPRHPQFPADTRPPSPPQSAPPLHSVTPSPAAKQAPSPLRPPRPSLPRLPSSLSLSTPSTPQRSPRAPVMHSCGSPRTQSPQQEHVHVRMHGSGGFGY